MTTRTSTTAELPVIRRNDRGADSETEGQDIDLLSTGDLSIDTVQGGPSEPIRCFWRGKSNDRYPVKTLEPFFSSLIQAAEESCARLEMHFEELTHFNSSTITAFIQLIQNARSHDVRLVFYYDESLKWQSISFDALRVLTDDDGWFELESVQPNDTQDRDDGE